MTWMCEHDTAAETDTFGSRESAMLDTEDVGVLLGLDVDRNARHGTDPLRPGRRSPTSRCPTVSRNCGPSSTS
jgi:hypothetical protein